LKSRIILYAPNSHAGGGLILLKSLIKIWPEGFPCQGYFDSRASELLNLENFSSVRWVDPTITSRLKAEMSLSQTVSSNDVIIFFNSLPPIFTCKGRVIVFLQNRNFIESISLRSFNFKQMLRIGIERMLSYFLRSRVDEYIVQTDSFKRVLEKWYKRKNITQDMTITVFPFMDSDNFLSALPLERRVRQHDFIYVADGVAPKNHLALIDAWEILADLGHYPSLAITLPASEVSLLKNICLLQKKGVKIVNLGWLSHAEVIHNYQVSGALIFPSLRESFGLPLVEARKLNIPILASELDYVYDVCEPEETFDPKSPRSIARAVMRFLDISLPLRKVKEPDDFVNYILHSKIDGVNNGKN
jgi:hypothetical protein